MVTKQISSLFQTQSNAIASYNYADIAEGTGYTIFYGLVTRNLAGATYSLVTQTLRGSAGNINYSVDTTEESRIKQSGTSASYVKMGEIDFDLSAFNTPKTIKGTALIEYSAACIETDASRSKGYWVFKIIKDSDGTETVIGTANSEETDANGGGGVPPEKITGCIPITCTQTHFKRGDILRVTAEAWMYYIAGGENTYLHIPHSPQNNNTTNFTATTNPTYFKVHIPFRLEQ